MQPTLSARTAESAIECSGSDRESNRSDCGNNKGLMEVTVTKSENQGVKELSHRRKKNVFVSQSSVLVEPKKTRLYPGASRK